MERKNIFTVFLLIPVLLFVIFYLITGNRTSQWFSEYPIPLEKAHRLFDIGVVDANGDNHLDIYTSNHHFRQVLLISDGTGGYRDVLSDWGLDQSREFPLAEISYTAPEMDKPGLYIYWFGSQLLIRSHKLEEIGDLSGTLHVYDPIKIARNDGYIINKQQKVLTELKSSVITETLLSFSANNSAYLRLKPGGQGLPLQFEINGAIQSEQIFVGLGKISPQSTNFSLANRDRHALAWADFNGDEDLDVFINRGALGGSLLGLPKEVRQGIQDELLVRNEKHQFDDVSRKVGIRKKGCSGRHARWLDFNRDGLLDLYINCYDRKNAYGEFPKQLYIQNEKGQFRDKAKDIGIDVPKQQIGSFIWFDVDADGDIDLVTLQNEGFYLYRNAKKHLIMELIFQRKLSGLLIGSSTRGEWLYDGKLIAADYDTDGDLDLFASSKRGNRLFINHKGKFTYVNPVSIGLPEKSYNASWVDYDNDGMPDLHTVPQGLFKQKNGHNFIKTEILAFPDEQYLAAISNWFDLDNDGRLDLLMAVDNNPSYKTWWEFSKKTIKSTTWPIKVFHNIGASNHWLQLKLVGPKGNRQAIGTRVIVTTSDSQQIQEVGSSEGAFFSQGHYRLYFGLGEQEKVSEIKILWPDGKTQNLINVPGDRLIQIEKTGNI